MSNVKHISYYTNVMQQWGKQLGARPTEAQLAVAHVHGRPGKQSFIVAMALRDSGVTRSQMLEAAGLFDGKPTPQLNHMRALVNSKMFTRLPVPGAYALAVGPNHAKFAELHGAKAAETAKAEPKVSAKSKRKADRKAKVKAATQAAAVEPAPAPVEAPVVEQVTA